jgi:hypothetical protein
MLRKLVLCSTFCFCLGIAHAAVTVGTCQSAKNTYPTISAAIKAAPPYGTINVCPGTYAEQLIISKPLTINGLAIANQPGVTIVAPPTGVAAIPGASNNDDQIFAQVLVNNAGGPVNLSNLSIIGSTLLWGLGSQPATRSIANVCFQELSVNSSGVMYENTPGLLDNVSVSGQFGTPEQRNDGGEPTIDSAPNCGSGILLNNDPDTEAVVQDSAVMGAGLYGIYSSGELTAEHNIVSVSGPSSVGIEASSNGSVITDNAVTASLFIDSIGIDGGQSVLRNTVQGSNTGITGASIVSHNTLLGNSNGISGNNVSENLIQAAATTYVNPGCASNPGAPADPACTVPTVAIQLATCQNQVIQNNSIVNAGIGLEGVEPGLNFTATNLFAGVTTTSTTCTPSPSHVHTLPPHSVRPILTPFSR